MYFRESYVSKHAWVITFPNCVLCLVRGDDIFEAEHLPSYARTYILPKQMVSHETLDSNKMTINFDES